jgi:predicted alpha/beta superfamily hydrolase
MKRLFIPIFFVFLFANCQTTTSKFQDPPALPSTPLVISSLVLNEERHWNLWEPNSSSNKDTLPLLILLDGGLEEDFPHIVYTIDSLIRSGQMQPIRLAGIENTQRRRDFTGPTTVAKDREIAPIVGESGNFRQYLRDEAIPTLLKQFPNTSQVGLIGESLAGLFIMETFLLEPRLVDKYIAFDPSLWWNGGALTMQTDSVLSRLQDKHIELWFAGSDAKDISIYTRKVAKNLEKVDTTKIKWQYQDEPKLQHATIFRSKKVDALKWMYPKNEYK